MTVHEYNEAHSTTSMGNSTMRRLPSFCLCLLALALAVPAFWLHSASSHKKPTREPDVIYVPTPQEVVDKMLEMADVRKGEIVYDLGCGDARIPVMASKKYGVRSWGFDINPVRVKESLENVEKNNVKNLVTIKLQDIF